MPHPAFSTKEFDLRTGSRPGHSLDPFDPLGVSRSGWARPSV
jgi:hypothetical protein